MSEKYFELRIKEWKYCPLCGGKLKDPVNETTETHGWTSTSFGVKRCRKCKSGFVGGSNE